MPEIGTSGSIGMGFTNFDPSRRKYGSRVQCRVGDRSQHRNRDGLVSISICWHATNS